MIPRTRHDSERGEATTRRGLVCARCNGFGWIGDDMVTSDWSRTCPACDGSGEAPNGTGNGRPDEFCPKYGAQILPDEDDACSLCGAPNQHGLSTVGYIIDSEVTG